MLDKQKKKIPLLLYPFAVLWALLTFILKLTGRLLAAVLGLVLMIVGIVLTVIIVAAPLGIPFFILGLLLVIRSIF